MSDVKQVKVDNWGIYFLQRLKHFFNRTDYCDLTLQFQDNAQLKVHRLVLNACTEYFELLERTCEMYEDCLVMPDDLQADVVVPIINFMYTGQLEFKIDSLEKLYQTSLVMNMPVLTKLLEAHRNMHTKSQNFSGNKKNVKSSEILKSSKYTPNLSSLGKRSYNKAFENYKSPSKVAETSKSNLSSRLSDVTKSKLQSTSKIVYKEKKYSTPKSKVDTSVNNGNSSYRVPSPIPLDTELYNKKLVLGDPRPTRYELPEELDTDNIFENSFSKLSYTSQPLMVHPETTKHYSKKTNLFLDASASKKGMKSTVDIVECKKVSKRDILFEDDGLQVSHDDEMFQPAYLSVTDEPARDPNQLFDQILDGSEGPKVTIEGKDKQSGNLDHAKIISEVLKKYPHLVKGNKNIKLKILNTSAKSKKTPQVEEKIEVKPKPEVGYTYETDVLDSKEAAKLIAMGAENIKGPWICLICGTPGRALNFTSYYNFRRHLVEVHNEKPVSTICEYCGLRSFKRNYLLHHIYTKHGVPPPPQYHFPKCNMCDYVALTEAFLVKHKLNHSDTKTIRCYVCSVGFTTASQLLQHISKTGHRYNKEKKPNLQCVYCMKIFLRESNFYVHLKTSHREVAIRDGIIEDSDDERQVEVKPKVMHDVRSDIKYEQSFENDYEDADYPIQQKTDGNIKKTGIPTPTKHKILNPGFNSHSLKSHIKPKAASTVASEYSQDISSFSPQANEENIVVIDGEEYIMKENQLIPKSATGNAGYIFSEIVDNEGGKLPNLEASITPTTSIEFANMDSTRNDKKTANINQPIQIVVSNEEEYKALMSSNHSIIFDDGDSSKTLTVLTAPHTNSVDNAAIELQNTQSGDMMIIQQDYPLNVAEEVSTVSGDSKYVVVYTHAVGHEDPSKQYQIITPQEIGAEFVQASDVMTQSYETVTTTTTSVLDTHVIEPHMEEQWSEQTTDVQAIAHTEHEHENTDNDKVEQTTEQTIMEPTISDVELPEVQLSATDESMTSDQVTLQSIPQSVIQADVIETEGIQQNASEVMEVDVPSEVAADKLMSEGSEMNQMINEELVQSDALAHQEHSLVQTSSELLDDSQNSHEMPEQIRESHEIIEKEPTDLYEEENTVAQTNAIEVNTPAPKIAEQIQHIASEWSEDESDSVTEGPSDTNTPAEEIQAQITQESEMEESIENIQQEMKKQLTPVVDEVPVTDEFTTNEEIHLANPNNTDVCNQSEVPTENVVPTQVKLTSLLNDWEDNDSQEENTPNENEHEKGIIAETEEMQTTTNENNGVDQMSNDAVVTNKGEVENITKRDPKKDDNIKSLVSDWDEEEEETK